MADLLSELYDILEQNPSSVFVLERLVEAWLAGGKEGEDNPTVVTVR
jgi:hypothetical protein